MAILDYTLEELHERLVNGELSSVQIIEAVYDKIDETEANVGAFLALNKEEALKHARMVDENGIDPNNILSGLPIGIKDNIVTKGLTTTAASKMLEDFVPVYDATVVEKLAKAGMVSIGKLNMDEFAMGGSTENSAFKVTRNPWDLSKVPGGSSGGSAAAVAAGQVPVSLGSDTGGSIREPAAFTGIVGMKPTYGRVSRYGLIAFGSSLDQIGPFSRTVKDNALVLNAISGYDQRDSTSYKGETPDFTDGIEKGVKGMRIGVPKEYFNEDAKEKGIVDSVRAALKKYEELGAEIVEVSLPHSKYGIPAYYIIASSEASSNLQRFDGIRYGYRADNVNSLEELYVKSRSEGFGLEVKRRIMLGTFSLSAGFYDAHFKKAAQARTLIRQDFEKVFEEVDFLVAPTTTTSAFDIGGKIEDPLAMYMADILTVPVNLAGVPSVSIPCGFSNNMPVGMQLIGKHFDEQTLYRAAYAYEQATDFHKQRPNFKGGK
ncbi:Asp-tRNA(Asn)/Glu-tRNA(Gln) amidotransferase subunit GatA [Marinilactibacillus psychrotolerans]|uniref:Glutamyl-tRNA(Gln) amidotransferase subunit A n=2 Tax=Marinilactibacillus psychrotolerans TaxID=191770 RepID=A0A5R9C372_9LACT|nr:Asp-tRNA(Asn)/Glu-tRNA(Gln) amidotransferase subunit GatA [Marinilactibacillus psychrotolerans]TLQ07221.1 Asp-tRNA(Asn)/Glu-tRNA(Gln) amidotransferase subunit GatA [Marinilactibacillus psychrotolerans]GEQ33825.1 aspartyl/glutamyl-tRNA(Asn/Gln) amidotransferase subunit A [Marinilactibacillus psychrotolerans]SJN28943.1 Aspartyl-tRNA(Asn) amidotransferase subunit A amidotransferase subunit A [Marinilactibacillus psychrotolerans 42ea]